MLILALILIPILAAVGIYFGAPSKHTALVAAIANIAASIAAIVTNSSFKLNVFSSPNINLSLGFIDGISIVMLLLEMSRRQRKALVF